MRGIEKYCLVQLPRKRSVLFGCNSLKMSVSYNENLGNKFFIVLFASKSGGVYIVFVYIYC